MYSRIKEVSRKKTKAGATISNKVKETKNKLSFNLQKSSHIPTQSRVKEITASGEIPLSAFVEPEVTSASSYNSHPEKVRNLLRELDSYNTIENSGIWTQSELELYRLSSSNSDHSQRHSPEPTQAVQEVIDPYTSPKGYYDPHREIKESDYIIMSNNTNPKGVPFSIQRNLQTRIPVRLLEQQDDPH